MVDALDLVQYTPHLVVWSVFMLSGCILLIALFVLSSFPGVEPSNPLVRYIYFLFALCNLTGSLLIWTGNAFNTEPPYEVCLANAAFTLANTPVMAAAAFSLVVQVSSTVLFVHYPLLKGWFGWLTKVPLLLVIPLITGLPILVFGLNRGLRHPDQVLRGSPFYCTMEAPKLNIIVSIIAAVLELHCLVLASWTTIALLRTRWRVRSRATDVIDGPFNRPLVIRVLAFSFTNLMGFILAIATAVLSFSMVATDLMFSLIGCIVVVIFGWPTITSLCGCGRSSKTRDATSTRTAHAMTIGTMPVFQQGSGSVKGSDSIFRDSVAVDLENISNRPSKTSSHHLHPTSRPMSAVSKLSSDAESEPRTPN